MLIKNLWRRRTRTLLTALGVAIGVAAIVTLSAFSQGLADGFQGVMTVSEADLTVGQKDALMLLYSSVDADIGAELEQIRGVKAVAGTVVGFVQMTDSPYFVLMGEDPRGFGVCRVVHLVSPIEPEAIDLVGAHAPADVVGRFEHDDVTPRLDQFAGGVQAR